MAASEGVAAHVKPVPKGEFLKNEFPIRYRTSYFLLFSLAAYQHYRLIDLIGELANCMSNLDADIGNESRIDNLRRIRKKLVLHELKYITTQPTFLTNYQQYYAGLRQWLNTEALVQKLRRSARELDCLLADEEYRAKNLHEEQVHKGKVLLAKSSDRLILPVTVLPEVSYLIGSRLGHATMRQFLRQLAASKVAIEPVTMNDLKRMTEILTSYTESKLDFVDATIISLAERLNIVRIFTLDCRDFSIIKPRHHSNFEIMP